MAKLSQTEAQYKPPLPQKAKGKPKYRISPVETAAIAAFFLLPLLLPAVWSGEFKQWFPSQLRNHLFPETKESIVDTNPDSPSLLEACRTHKYSTEIVSLDPLVIYINNFTSFAEAEALIKLGEPEFADSFIARANGKTQKVGGRTSQSAPLDDHHPLVSCIISRARHFMGSTLQPYEPFSLPQLVRYAPSQRYDLHTDFWPQHQLMKDGSGRLFNRPASFFVFLRGNCTGGETYFPSIDVFDKDAERGGELEAGFMGKVSRGEKDGVAKGVRFRPITGNAVYWVNINKLGKGDRRVVHAGLPVGEGEKIGMNLWPRKFY